MNEFLEPSEIVDFGHAAVRTLAAGLGRHSTAEETAAHCFRWVRDSIRHSGDCRDDVVTISASEVLQHGTGLCYAKSHLLAALLRANQIPSGFAYQRVALDDAGRSFCLHGLCAVWLVDHGWYKVDARGNRDDIKTDFDPPSERLAFATENPGEQTYEQIFAAPLPVVVSALRRHESLQQLNDHLPDWVDQ